MTAAAPPPPLVLPPDDPPRVTVKVSGRWGADLLRELIRTARRVKCPRPGSPATPSGSGAAAAAAVPPSIHATDLGNAERLVARFGDRIRYVAKAGRWFVYDGQRWCAGDDTAIFRYAARVASDLFAESGAIQDSDERRAALKHAFYSESAKAIKAAVALASNHERVSAAPDAFDRDPWLFNCANGTLNLRTGELRPHAPADLITKLAPVAYDPAANCPTWLSFLDSIFAGDSDLIAFVRRAIGYALTGSTREQVVFFLYGTGSNGKSTFLDLLRDLLGDYAKSADFATFLHHDRETIRNDLADLAGSRLVTAAETNEGQRLDEGVIKKVAGGDPIKARFLFREYFEYTPTFKVFLATNHRPVIRGGEHAIWRRIRLIPFKTTIPDDKQDLELPKKLRCELAGVLNWAVAGAIELQTQRLGIPPAVYQATEEYREEMDCVTRYFKDCVLVIDKGRVGATELYTNYCRWCTEVGEPAKTQRWFGLRLSERGFKKYKDKVYYWENLELRASSAGVQETLGDLGTITQHNPNESVSQKHLYRLRRLWRPWRPWRPFFRRSDDARGMGLASGNRSPRSPRSPRAKTHHTPLRTI